MSQRRAERVVESKFYVVTESIGAPRLRGKHPLHMPPTEYPPSNAVNETPSIGSGQPGRAPSPGAMGELVYSGALTPVDGSLGASRIDTASMAIRPGGGQLHRG